MAPRRQSTSASSALLAAQRVIDSEDKYRQNVKTIQSTSKLLAESLAPAGELEQAMEISQDSGLSNFLDECRIRLKGISEGNAKRMKEIDYFVEAVREVKNDVVTRQQDDNDEAVDYEAAIHTAVERIRDNDTNAQQDMEQHYMVVEMRTTLGEKLKNDDDDLEIVNTGDDVHALKCPITGTFFEDPVKNKVCGHSYSRGGLQQVLKNRKTSCPVTGCRNNGLSLQQVEEDEEMRMKVARFKKREEQAKRKRELEDEADEEEMGEGGFTLIN
jgi:hypothetical protein